MGISDLFRSKHRHSDPEVRAAAVRALSGDDTETLLAIARDDDDSEVRKLAIERLGDPDALARIAAGESEATLRLEAERRAADLWVQEVLDAPADEAGRLVVRLAKLEDPYGLVQVVIRASDDAVREAALDRIRDDRALADVARSRAAPQLRLQAIDRITDGDTLRAIAMDEEDREVAVAAVDRIADPELLSAVAQKAKLKAARSRARKATGELPSGEPTGDEMSDEEKRIHAERAQLLRIVESIAERHEWVESLAELEDAESTWNALGPCDDPEIATRFESACKLYRARREKYATQAEKQASNPVPNPAPVPDPPEHQPDPPTSEAPATPTPEAPATPTPEALSKEAPSKPEPQPPPEPELTGEALATRKAENKTQLERIVGELETIDNIKKLKTAEKKLSKTQSAFEKLNPLPGGADVDDLVARYHAAHKKLFIKVQEMREADEWQRWANVPKREALVARANELLEAELDGKLAGKLKQLQTEWKEVGPVPQKRGQELWDEFKKVCDRVYERVKEYRAHAAEERKVNLEKKRELCEKVEAIMDSTEWATTAEEIKRLQAEWKKIGPVPRKHADAIWKRFRGACDHFFERRKPHLEQKLGEQQQNLDRKMKLIEEAEELSQSTDWKETAQTLRDLQKRWKKIGFVPRKDASTVNKRFRAACDLFFERRKQHFEELDKQKEQALAELGQQLEAAAAETDGEPAARVQKALELRQAVLSADGPKKAVAELTEKLQALQRVVVESCGDALSGTELDPRTNRKRMSKLVARAEELAPEDAPAAKPKTAEEMAEQLRQAFSKNALGGVNSKTGGRPASEIVGELRESWQRLAPVPGPEGEELQRRFRSACDRALASEK